MSDILKSHLDATATPELTEAIMGAIAAFDRLDIPSYDAKYEEIIMVEETMDPADTLIAIVDLTRKMIDEILLMHAVVLSESATISECSHVLNGLIDIQEFSDKELIYQTIMIDAGSEEIFAELMALVSPMNASALLPVIESVDASLIRVIREKFANASPTPTPESVRIERQKYLDTFSRYLHFFDQPGPEVVVRRLVGGLEVGYGFDAYIKLAREELQQLEPEALAKELISFAVISKDGKDNPRNIIRQFIDQLVSDIEIATKVDVKVNEYLLAYERT